MRWNHRIRRPSAAIPLLAFLLCLGACDSGGNGRAPTGVTRDTLANGAVHVVYGSQPTSPAHGLEIDLELGRTEDIVFGNIRGLELTTAEELLVLDYQASEVRRFDLDGNDLGLVTGSGEGPGEIAAANGLWMDSEDALWINDHGNWRLSRLLPGDSVETVPFFVMGYAYLWNGGVTPDGRVWSAVSASDDPPGPREPGLVEGASRSYFKFLDRSSGDVDSVFVGFHRYRSVVLPRGGASIPFAPQRHLCIDPTGSIWTGNSGDYSVARLSLGGDTLVVIDVNAEAPPVTDAERDEAIEGVESFMERAGPASVDWDEALPRVKPHFVQLASDDQGNLWVMREGISGSVFDVFSPDGELVGVYEAAFEASPYFRPVIRRGWLLTIRTDSMGVQSVVASRVPGMTG
jgi:hypothetical protein